MLLGDLPQNHCKARNSKINISAQLNVFQWLLAIQGTKASTPWQGTICCSLCVHLARSWGFPDTILVPSVLTKDVNPIIELIIWLVSGTAGSPVPSHSRGSPDAGWPGSPSWKAMVTIRPATSQLCIHAKAYLTVPKGDGAWGSYIHSSWLTRWAKRGHKTEFFSVRLNDLRLKLKPNQLLLSVRVTAAKREESKQILTLRGEFKSHKKDLIGGKNNK